MLKNKIGALLIDLDGTLYFKNKTIPGAPETIEKIREKGFLLRFLTNTDSKTTKYIHKMLIDYGFNIKIEEIHTPITASIKFLNSFKDKFFYPLVSNEVLSEYTGMNIKDYEIDFLLIGDIRDKINYDILNKAFRMLTEKTEIIALQKGKFFYNNEGKNLDTGSFVQLFEYASDKTAKIIGKPSKDFFEIAIKDLSLTPQEVLIVGDDITTDIYGANVIGSKSILVKTGKYTNDLFNKSNIKPDSVINTINDILPVLI